MPEHSNKHVVCAEMRTWLITLEREHLQSSYIWRADGHGAGRLTNNLVVQIPLKLSSASLSHVSALILLQQLLSTVTKLDFGIAELGTGAVYVLLPIGGLSNNCFD